MQKQLTITLDEQIYESLFQVIKLPRQHRQESVKRHRQWQATLNQSDFFNQVFGSHNHDEHSAV
jgi:formiminotetrahydrofolate cyclodeaminase